MGEMSNRSQYLLAPATPNSSSNLQPISAVSPNVYPAGPTTNVLGYNPPLSIDFVRKIKRPTHIPHALEYTNNQVFQGTLLEEWLMQTLDEHIHSAAYINQSLLKQVFRKVRFRFSAIVFMYVCFPVECTGG